MVSTKMKMSLLVAAHVVAGLLVWLFCADLIYPISSFVLLPLIFADAGLVGIWGGLSAARLVWRLLAPLAAILYLWAILSFGRFDPTKLEFWVHTISTLAVLMVLVGLRYSPFRLRLARLPNVSQLPQGFQFSIRSLLLATATVAVVFGIGRTAYAISDNYPNAVYFVMFPLCIIVVTLAMLWATLSKGRPTYRLTAVVPAAFLVGTTPMVYAASSRTDWLAMALWPCVFGLQAIITAASLLIVRSCGWRLVTGANGDGVQVDGTGSKMPIGD